jgi:hypothetical protein
MKLVTQLGCLFLLIIPLLILPGCSTLQECRIQREGFIGSGKFGKILINPYLTDTTTQKDLTRRLPACGSMAHGISTLDVFTSRGGMVIPHKGWVSFCTRSTGGTASISFKNNFTVDMTDADIVMDEIHIGILYRVVSPKGFSSPGSTFDVLLYGDNSTNNIPVSMSMDLPPANPKALRPNFNTMLLEASAIPQDFHKISNMVLRYRGKAGGSPEIQIKQIYLWVSRVQ